jgi:tRNA modification GTPase
METYAAVMTKQASGAISTIQLTGRQAEEILRGIFQPLPAEFKTGEIFVGEITDGDKRIDQAAVGCEGEDSFAIHCHGNPLICEMIMDLLAQKGAELTDADTLRTKTTNSEDCPDTISLEAELEYPHTPTLFAAKLVLKQSQAGLKQSAEQIIENFPDISAEQIRGKFERILADTEIAEKLVRGCDIIMAGPANSGKSTLLNSLAGSQKAIVTPHKGTTRDWITSTIKISNLVINLTDTAGLDKTLTEAPDSQAQQNVNSLLENACLVLVVLDINAQVPDFNNEFMDILKTKKTLTVLNKKDLPEKLNIEKLPYFLQNAVKVSAARESGFEELTARITNILKTDTIQPETPICFTARQRQICAQITECKDKNRMRSLITELLTGKICV